jgi:hypothetical protein
VRTVAPNLAPGHINTLIRVIGEVEEHAVTTTPSKNVLARMNVNPTTWAYGSEVAFMRARARELHDDHLLQDMPTRSLDIVACVYQNELQGRAKFVLDEGYNKLIADNNKYTLDREAFNRLVNSTFITNGKLPGAMMSSSPTA